MRYGYWPLHCSWQRCLSRCRGKKAKTHWKTFCSPRCRILPIASCGSRWCARGSLTISWREKSGCGQRPRDLRLPMTSNRRYGQFPNSPKTFMTRGGIAALLLCGLACVTRGQAPAGIDTGSLTRWPPYVHDTETLNRGRIVLSLVGGHSMTGDQLSNSSLYMEFEFGLTNRVLLAVAGSTSVSSRAATKLDDAVVHLRSRFVNESSSRPAFAVAATVQRQTFLKGTGISPYELQLALITEK